MENFFSKQNWVLLFIVMVGVGIVLAVWSYFGLGKEIKHLKDLATASAKNSAIGAGAAITAAQNTASTTMQTSSGTVPSATTQPKSDIVTVVDSTTGQDE